MARDEAPPFELGQTYFQGNTPDTAVGNQLLGKIWVFNDFDLNAANTGGTIKPGRTGMYRHMMAVRNTNSVAMLPKLLAKMDTTGSVYEITQATKAYGALGDLAYPIDEFLPAAGVAVNDIFWVCVGGPATVITDTAGTTNFTPGLGVVAGSGTAGHVVAQNTSVAAGTATFAQVNGLIGYCIVPINATNTDMLIYVTPKYF